MTREKGVCCSDETYVRQLAAGIPPKLRSLLSTKSTTCRAHCTGDYCIYRHNQKNHNLYLLHPMPRTLAQLHRQNIECLLLLLFSPTPWLAGLLWPRIENRCLQYIPLRHNSGNFTLADPMNKSNWW